LLCFVGFDAFVLRLARLFRQSQKGNSPKFAAGLGRWHHGCGEG
jgi:hypothetical protein